MADCLTDRDFSKPTAFKHCDYVGKDRGKRCRDGLTLNVFSDEIMPMYSFDKQYKDLNLNLSSLSIPRNSVVILYDGFEGTGNSVVIKDHVSCLTNVKHPSGGSWNDRARSVRFLREEDNVPWLHISNKACSFSDSIIAEPIEESIETITVSSALRNANNETFMAFYIPPGWKLMLYDDTYYRGNSIELTRDVPCLGMMYPEWRNADKLKSLRVQKQGQPDRFCKTVAYNGEQRMQQLDNYPFNLTGNNNINKDKDMMYCSKNDCDNECLLAGALCDYTRFNTTTQRCEMYKNDPRNRVTENKSSVFDNNFIFSYKL